MNIQQFLTGNNINKIIKYHGISNLDLICYLKEFIVDERRILFEKKKIELNILL